MNMEKLKQKRFMRVPLAVYRIARRSWWRVRGRWRLFKIISRQEEICLELGAGEKVGKGNWVTIDMNGECDIYYNLATGIPFPDNSVSRIYSSHFFEHLSPAAANACIKECLRVLKQNGEFSIAVPNARLYAEAYLLGNKIDINIGARTPIDYLRFIAYCGGQHQNVFDANSLMDLLIQNDFQNASLREFDNGVDLDLRKWETIYAVGYKR